MVRYVWVGGVLNGDLCREVFRGESKTCWESGMLSSGFDVRRSILYVPGGSLYWEMSMVGVGCCCVGVLGQAVFKYGLCGVGSKLGMLGGFVSVGGDGLCGVSWVCCCSSCCIVVVGGFVSIGGDGLCGANWVRGSSSCCFVRCVCFAGEGDFCLVVCSGVAVRRIGS